MPTGIRRLAVGLLGLAAAAAVSSIITTPASAETQIFKGRAVGIAAARQAAYNQAAFAGYPPSSCHTIDTENLEHGWWEVDISCTR